MTMIDFSKLEKPEGMTDEMLQDAGFQTFVQGLIDTQKKAASSVGQAEIERLRQEKAIADQKSDDLRNRLEAAQKNKGGDQSAEIEALQKQLTEKEGVIDGLNQKIDLGDVRSYLTNQLNDYNAKNPTHSVLPGAERHVIDAALKAFRKVEGGDIRAFNGDEPLTGQNGFMTGSEFFSKYRDSDPFFFGKPSGSGANGGDKNGGASNKITRAEFDALPQATRMEKVRSGVQITE